jgi:hypothetical protein
MSTDRMRTIEAVKALDGGRLQLRWSDGTEADVVLDKKAAAIPDFAKAELGDWGHSVVWPSGLEIGADRLWLQTLSATQRDDARQFLEWRMRNALSLSKTAEALGLARRTVAYYSNGERAVPKSILLACKGWEVSELRKAA